MRYAAVFEILLNLMVVSNIADHNNTISIKANNGDFNPKNIADQSMFSASWTKKNIIALFLSFFFTPFLDHTMKKATPIARNKKVHTGANTEFGGLKLGFWIEAYHKGIAEDVNMDPTAPASWHINIEIISFIDLSIICINQPAFKYLAKEFKSIRLL